MSESKTQLIPHLCIRGAREAADFYRRALGAEVICTIPGSDGRIMHSAMSIDGQMVYMADEFPEHGGTSPLALGGTPVHLHLQVSDCDATFARAVEAGCKPLMTVQEMFWGDRYGIVEDPFGHRWSFATTVKPMSIEDLQQVAAAMAGDCPNT